MSTTDRGRTSSITRGTILRADCTAPLSCMAKYASVYWLPVDLGSEPTVGHDPLLDVGVAVCLTDCTLDRNQEHARPLQRGPDDVDAIDHSISSCRKACDAFFDEMEQLLGDRRLDEIAGC